MKIKSREGDRAVSTELGRCSAVVYSCSLQSIICITCCTAVSVTSWPEGHSQTEITICAQFVKWLPFLQGWTPHRLMLCGIQGPRGFPQHVISSLEPTDYSCHFPLSLPTTGPLGQAPLCPWLLLRPYSCAAVSTCPLQFKGNFLCCLFFLSYLTGVKMSLWK